MAIGTMIQSISSSPDVTQLQSAVNQALGQVKNVAIVSGRQLTQINLTTGQVNQIPHKLDRKAQGYFISSISAGAFIWNDSFTDDKFIPLYCSANCTVDIWVY